MRSVLLGLGVFGLAGCATVSMVPGEASVETGISAEQSALRQSSDQFCENAEKAGWVQKSSGVMGLARILMHGNDDAQDEDASDYAQSIQAETAELAVVFERIAADAEAARLGLAQVVMVAEGVLAGETPSRRADVMSFERSLIAAQKSHRNFARAADVASQRAEAAPVAVDAALDGFGAEIDKARRIADRLADKYADLEKAVS